MSTVRRYEHLDFRQSDLAKPETTQEGYWKLDGKVARTGVQIYRNADGSERRELRLPEDVKASLPGFNLKPLTNNHPPQLVRPDNAQQYVAGAVGEAEYADGWVRAPVTLWTKDAIDAVKAGRAQLSVGYTCKLVDEAGTWQGEKYDSRQTDIVVNHVALVDAARAGPEARLRLDAGDAETHETEEIRRADLAPVASALPTPIATQETKRMAHKMTLDGLELEVADANAQAIITRAVASAEKKGQDAAAAERARADGLTDKVKALESEKTALQAKVDTLDAAAKKMVDCDACDGTGKVGGEVCDDCSGTGSVKMDSLADKAWRKSARERAITRAVGARADARAKLLVQAAEHLSANEKLDGKSDVEIKKLVLSKICKDLKLDGKDDVYVSHRYDFELEQLAKSKGKAHTRALELVRGPDLEAKKDGEVVDAFDGETDGRALMQKRNREMFVKRGK